MNKKYEKTISLLGIFRSLKRNIISILGFTLIVFCFSTIYLNLFTTKTYQTNARLSNKTNITLTSLTTLTDTIKSDYIMEKTTEEIASKNMAYSNGKQIAIEDIKNNLILPTTNNSLYVTISLKGTDKAVLKNVLEIVLTNTVEYLKVENATFTGLKIADEPSEPVDISKTTQKICVFSIMALAVACVISLTIDIKYDLVYNIDDIKDLSTNVLELNYTERK